MDAITKDDLQGAEGEREGRIIGTVQDWEQHDGTYGEFIVFHGEFYLTSPDGESEQKYSEDLILPGRVESKVHEAYESGDLTEDGDLLYLPLDILVYDVETNDSDFPINWRFEDHLENVKRQLELDEMKSLVQGS